MFPGARVLHIEAQKHNRRIAFRMREQGYTYAEIAKVLGVDIRTVFHWFQQAAIHGKEAAIHGGKSGGSRGRTLTSENEKHIRETIINNTPDKIGLPYSIWSREAVQTLIKREFGIDMPITTVGLYLRRWKFTPKKPEKRSYGQNPKETKAWAEEKFAEIERRAHEEGSQIVWEDETGVKNDETKARSYYPVGKTPLVNIPAKRASINVISLISREGDLQYIKFNGTLNSDQFIQLLENLTSQWDGKKFMIFDKHPVHRSRKVKEWLEAHKDKIEVFELPPYSPDINPVEYLNNDLKQRVHTGVLAKTQHALEEKAESILKWMKSSTGHIKSWFNHSDVSYANMVW